jgi:hypothetical protein
MDRNPADRALALDGPAAQRSGEKRAAMAGRTSYTEILHTLDCDDNKLASNERNSNEHRKESVADSSKIEAKPNATWWLQVLNQAQAKDMDHTF